MLQLIGQQRWQRRAQRTDARLAVLLLTQEAGVAVARVVVPQGDPVTVLCLLRQGLGAVGCCQVKPTESACAWSSCCAASQRQAEVAAGPMPATRVGARPAPRWPE